MSMGMLTRRAGEWVVWRERTVSWGAWGTVSLSTSSPRAEPTHRLTMEMLTQEKCLYSGASC